MTAPPPPTGGLALFARQLLLRPKEISAIAPSSAALARAMTEGLGPKTGRVVEFGPGTGALTRAIIARGVAPADMTLFEMNPDFVAYLRNRFPGTIVHHTGAQDAGTLCPAGVGAVVSGLPLLSFPHDLRRAILMAAFAILRPGAPYVQFTYGPRPPIPDEMIAELGLLVERGPKFWTNLPPARVYRFRQSG